MIFGTVPLAEAEGAVLAHSVRLPGGKLAKGARLGPEEVARLDAAGLEAVTVAREEPGDVAEDVAAARLAAALLAPGLTAGAPGTGRVNLFAGAPGLFRADRAAVDAVNAADPAVTLATLADATRVAAGQMVATVKIIPYAVPGAALDRAAGAAAAALRLHPVRPRAVDLILTRTEALTDKALAKGRRVVLDRIAALGCRGGQVLEVDHSRDALAAALAATTADPVLILTASATTDAADVAPSAVVAAGGRLERVGMPVDPGNLLFLGALAGRTVLGLPGCARSPAPNGADWVLERLVCDVPVTSGDIAAMGVGGLLAEIPSRPAPRRGAGGEGIAILVLASGASRRMRGRDKLMEPVAGEPLLTCSLRAARAAGLGPVIAVVPPEAEAPARAAAARAVPGVEVVENPGRAEGMAASIRLGIAAAAGARAAILALADMPEIDAAAYRALAAAFDPEAAPLVRATAADGTPGHPVLFGKRYFESLGAVAGDVGAREVVRAAGAVRDVALPGRAALTDLDTPEAWAAWRAPGLTESAD